MAKEIKSVDDLVDMGIVDFIKYSQKLTMGQTRSFINLLQKEGHTCKLVINEELKTLKVDPDNLDNLKAIIQNTAGLSVALRRIMDRVDILTAAKTLKGIVIEQKN